MKTEALYLLGGVFVVIQVMMFVLWLKYKSKKNAGIVDIGWAFSFTPAALIYQFFGVGDMIRSFLITMMFLIWSLRLTLHLYNRYEKNPEDPRYVRMREAWKGYHDLKMLGVFLFQGTIAFFLTIPSFVANINPAPELDFYQIFGFLIWLIGFVGETKADWILLKFKENPVNKNKVCQEGLWRYSRHPNYFFEWVVWMGFFTYNLGYPVGWIAFYCPFIILYLLLNVSGIPSTELQLLYSKGEAYKDYRRNTSYFIPWWPRRRG